MNLENLSSATNHNGGAIHFGPDGKLYVAVGENANGANAQTLANRLGQDAAHQRRRQHPHRQPVLQHRDRQQPGDLGAGTAQPVHVHLPARHRADVHQRRRRGTWEEINDGIAGSNYGWPTTEGPTTDPRFRAPLFAVSHTGRHAAPAARSPAAPSTTRRRPRSRARSSASISSPTSAPASSGCSIPPPGPTPPSPPASSSPVDLKVDRTARCITWRAANGSVGRVRPSATNQPPQITTQPQSQTRAVGQSATFTVAASGAAPLSFQWQRNGANIAGATSATLHHRVRATSDNGAMFRAVVTQRVRLGDQQRGHADRHGQHAAHRHHHRARPRTPSTPAAT